MSKSRRQRALGGAAALVAAALVAGMSLPGAEARSTATPANVAPPTITGLAVTGETLTASAGSWTGTPPLTLTIAWQRCDAGGAVCAVIPGQTAPTYVVDDADIGFTLRVLVTATNGEGSGDAPSPPTAVVTGPLVPVNTAEPVVSGSPVEGSALTVSTGAWTGAAIEYTYQWVRCPADGGLPDGSNCPTITGATSPAYIVTQSDVGSRLRAQVIASNSAGSAAAVSNPSDVVQKSTTTGPPLSTSEPSVTGTPTLARALTASVGTWSGALPITFAYQWLRCGPDGGLPDGSNCTSIAGATTSSYVAVADDVGQRLRVRVTASNGEGSRSATSNATEPVQASATGGSLAPANSILPSVSGTAAVGETLFAGVGTWRGAAPLTYAYQWLRCGAGGGQPSGSDCTAIAGATLSRYAVASGDLGQRLRVRVTARNASGTATATSDATEQVLSSAPTPPVPTTPVPTTPRQPTLPPGGVRLSDGTISVPVASVSLPQRLVVGRVIFRPNPVRSRKRPLEVRVRIRDSRGYVVRGALVRSRAVPAVTSAPAEKRTARNGWVRFRVTPKASFPLRRGRSVTFQIRARKASDGARVGVSARRLVKVATVG